jgi:hypothetical protein
MNALADNMPSTPSNPFVVDRVDSPWQEPEDIPGINRVAFEQSLRSIRDTRAARQSRGLILHGEPGSGKTHLLHRVRRYTCSDPLAWFVYVPAVTGPTRFWRHVLEKFFHDLCQRSKQADPPPSSGPSSMVDSEEPQPGQGPLTQIEEALAKHLVNDPLGKTRDIARRWADICQQTAPGGPLFERLRRTMDRLTIDRQLDGDVMTALRHYLSGHHRKDAYTFLRGRDLPESALQRLGLSNSLDDEERAKQAVLTFCRLAGHPFTIILAFDQLEALQLDPHDMAGLRAYAQHAVELLSECANVLAISSVQTSFLNTLKQAIHTSYYDRLAQDESVLNLLTKEQAFDLVESRLKSNLEVAAMRGSGARLDRLWPLNSRAIERAILGPGISARSLIRECRKLFDAWLGMRQAAPTLEPAAPERLDRAWAEQFEDERTRAGVHVDAGVYEDGLLKLLQAKPPGAWRPERGTDKDLHIVLTKGAERIGISVSTSENMASVSKRLGRLLEQAKSGAVTRVIFLQDPRFPITSTAKKAQERRRELENGGHRIPELPSEAYVALTVLRRLWAEAAEGALTIDDQSIALGELQRWLAAHTPRPLQDLWEMCQAIDEKSATDESANLVLEALRGRWIVVLDELAKLVGLPSRQVESITAQKPDFFGLIRGSPPLVFLNPNTVHEA